MKNHIVPAEATHKETPEGGVHISNSGFNWKKATARALKHQLYRAIHLCRTNPDYQIQYPSEIRANPERKLLLHCHPEAEKRILHDHEKILKSAIVPTVERPQRFNRLG